MFAVIFAFHPKPGKKAHYLELAQYLKPKLKAIDGFIDNDRFESIRRPGWLLSLSTWRDEKSLVRWRTVGEHHAAQEQGRTKVFDDYRLRIGEIAADTAPPPDTPLDATRFDTTQVGAGHWATITEITSDNTTAAADDSEQIPYQLGLDDNTSGLITSEVFDSIYHPGKKLLILNWRDADAAATWQPTSDDADLRHRHVRVIREYGMYDRREAPQYYPDVERTD